MTPASTTQPLSAARVIYSEAICPDQRTVSDHDGTRLACDHRHDHTARIVLAPQYGYPLAACLTREGPSVKLAAQEQPPNVPARAGAGLRRKPAGRLRTAAR